MQIETKMNHPLREYLNKTGEGVAEFAFRANLSEQAIYKILNGERKQPRITTIKKIIDATNNMLSYLELIQMPAPKKPKRRSK